jgi:predicted glutamine amidotransferase
MGDEEITQDMVTQLLLDNERRGNNATGVAIQDYSGTINVLKDDEPAWNFVRSKKYKDLLEEHLPTAQIVLGHTRQATKGSPRDPANNHPLFVDETAVVHNGMISNDDKLFEDMKLKRNGEVDSDILRAILDKHGMTRKGIEQLKRVSGSCAIAAISTKTPGKLLLGRCGSPLVIASTNGLMIWSSEKQSIHCATRPVKMRWGFPFQPNRADLAFITMNDDQIYLIGPPKDNDAESSIEWHTDFQLSHYYRQPLYKPQESYGPTRTRFYKGLISAVWCENCKAYMEVPKELQAFEPWRLQCNECGKTLARPPLENKG